MSKEIGDPVGGPYEEFKETWTTMKNVLFEDLERD